MITTEDIPGWVVTSMNGNTIALDISLSDNLISEGLAREVINRVQNLRKDLGFEVTDRIEITLSAEEKLANAINNNLNYICSETLADEIRITPYNSLEKVEEMELTEGVFTRIELLKNKDMSSEKTRYSDSELEEFRQIIQDKIDKAENDLELIKSAYTNDSNNGTDDTSPTFKGFEEGSETLSKEENAQLALRQEKFIHNLYNALKRIDNKTYGVCRVTGKLIQKERLKLVPHATLSIEAKRAQ